MATYRELKFQQFASVQYDGIIYMTPQDFLESVTEDTPRRKCTLKNLPLVSILDCDI